MISSDFFDSFFLQFQGGFQCDFIKKMAKKCQTVAKTPEAQPVLFSVYILEFAAKKPKSSRRPQSDRVYGCSPFASWFQKGSPTTQHNCQYYDGGIATSKTCHGFGNRASRVNLLPPTFKNPKKPKKNRRAARAEFSTLHAEINFSFGPEKLPSPPTL